MKHWASMSAVSAPPEDKQQFRCRLHGLQAKRMLKRHLPVVADSLASCVIAAAILSAGCGQHVPPNVGASTRAAKMPGGALTTVAQPVTPTLKPGGNAYVRVSRYTLMSGPPVETETTSAGVIGGYYVKDLAEPGAMTTRLAMSKVPGDAPKFVFGEALKLVKRAEGFPISWIVSKGNHKVSMPEFLLTANKAELDYLKSKDRVPTSMAYVYEAKDGEVRVWGYKLAMIPVAVCDSHGLAIHMGGYDGGNSMFSPSIPSGPPGTSPFAIKGNAVVFDKAVLDTAWKPWAPVSDANRQPFHLSSSCLYYCVAESDKQAFEPIELKQFGD